jgi:hypothetical protein
MNVGPEFPDQISIRFIKNHGNLYMYRPQRSHVLSYRLVTKTQNLFFIKRGNAFLPFKEPCAVKTP